MIDRSKRAALRRKKATEMNKALALLDVKQSATFENLFMAFDLTVGGVRDRRKDCMNLLIEFFGPNKPLLHIGPAEAVEFYEWLREEKDYHYNTVNRLTNTLSKVYMWAQAGGYIKSRPFEMVRPDHRKFRQTQLETKTRLPLSPKDFERLMLFLKTDKHYSRKSCVWIRHAVALGYYTGLRWGDIKNLEWSAFQEGQIIVHTRKTRRRIAIPINHPLVGGTELVKELADLKPMWDSPYVFPMLVNNPREIPLRRYIYPRLKIKAHGFYSLRHAFVTRLKNNGVSLEEIATYVGHADKKMTMNYSH